MKTIISTDLENVTYGKSLLFDCPIVEVPILQLALEKAYGGKMVVIPKEDQDENKEMG